MAADATYNMSKKCCASCGRAANNGDIKLKTCTACKSVQYCGIKCQREHWSKHKMACKKRAAELHEEILFKQSESNHWGDCPIWFLPHPLFPQKPIFMVCCSCSKLICMGCDYTNQWLEFREKRPHLCAFCRHPTSQTKGVERISKMPTETYWGERPCSNLFRSQA